MLKLIRAFIATRRLRRLEENRLWHREEAERLVEMAEAHGKAADLIEREIDARILADSGLPEVSDASDNDYTQARIGQVFNTDTHRVINVVEPSEMSTQAIEQMAAILNQSRHPYPGGSYR